MLFYALFLIFCYKSHKCRDYSVSLGDFGCNIRDAVHISLYYYSLLMCHYIACILLFTLVFLSFYVSTCVMNKPHHNCDYSTAQHYGFIANLVLNPAVKEFRKSVNIWNSYCPTKNSSRFFETQCINKWKRFVCPF